MRVVCGAGKTLIRIFSDAVARNQKIQAVHTSSSWRTPLQASTVVHASRTGLQQTSAKRQLTLMIRSL